jgi:hypothetical protein
VGQHRASTSPLSGVKSDWHTQSPGVKQSRQRWTPSNPASVRPTTPHTSGGSSPPGRPWLRRWRTPSCRRTVDGQRHCLGCHASGRLLAVREELSSRGDPVGGCRLALRRRMVLRGWWHRPPPLRCVIDRVEDRRCRGQVPGVTCLLIRVGTRRRLHRPSHSPCLPAAPCLWRGHSASSPPRQDHRKRQPRP